MTQPWQASNERAEGELGLPSAAQVQRQGGVVVALKLPWSEDAPQVVNALLAAPAGRGLKALILTPAPLPEDHEEDVDEYDEDGVLIGPSDDVQRTLAEAIARIDLGRLQTLRLPYLRLGDAGAQALAEAAALSGLAGLDLRYNVLGDEGLAALLADRRLAALRRLELQHNRIGPAGARALTQAALGLALLDLRYNPLGVEGAAALAQAPAAASLETLRLYLDDVTPAGARALACSPHLRLTLRRYWSAR